MRDLSFMNIGKKNLKEIAKIIKVNISLVNKVYDILKQKKLVE